MSKLKASDVHYISERESHITTLKLDERENEDGKYFVLGIDTPTTINNGIKGLFIQLSPEGLVELGKDLITVGSEYL